MTDPAGAAACVGRRRPGCEARPAEESPGTASAFDILAQPSSWPSTIPPPGPDGDHTPGLVAKATTWPSGSMPSMNAEPLNSVPRSLIVIAYRNLTLPAG